MCRIVKSNYRARSPRAFRGRTGVDKDQLEQLREHLARVDARIRARRASQAA